MKKRQNITGVILSGGKSSRMGENKSLLKINGITVIEIILRLMEPFFEEIILSTNDPEEYKFLGLKSAEDVYRNSGPLAGIHSALKNSATEKNFVISCDVPLMSAEMIEYFLNYESRSDILISRAAGYLQPLVGIYNKKLLPLIENILEETGSRGNHKSLHRLLDAADTTIIDPAGLEFYSDELFFNMNNKDDYEAIMKRLME
ncbi:molybdopterin-guanine dinucleotide biosynthesis protein A [Melioribacter roseus P3M-2]|uniref:Probable molybdenum cofactor guanylyltransferase n=1 Tax=Melioribacter roseus (strain DSM 23840 / JCM 17771 / VKM B-2668 / P3M-2) TaxID=1191523 RepID=I6YUS6_MELRP|nr:molybdenum cofactor guanylyltransferase [Melioribacter roseus]AFN74322.1 molybdopterin-guanine dinucleotide biosynthesis protein A [Melioribacter roseus P3M-2]